MIIGLCGKSASGKGTLARNIVEVKENAIHVDIDKIGHAALEIEEVMIEAVKAFGEKIIIDGKINRKVLAELVFNSRDEMEKLTNITWKHMVEMIDKIIEENKDKIIILDWLLLDKTKYFKRCDLTILINVPYEERLIRAIKRDGITEEDFLLRDSNSGTYDYEMFDYVLSDEEEIRKMVKII